MKRRYSPEDTKVILGRKEIKPTGEYIFATPQLHIGERIVDLYLDTENSSDMHHVYVADTEPVIKIILPRREK